jgi:hypothetical protein
VAAGTVRFVDTRVDWTEVISFNKGALRVVKFAAARPYADPEAAARKLVEIANSVEAVQDGRIHIELFNGPMLFDLKSTPAEYTARLKLAIDRGCLQMHET